MKQEIDTDSLIGYLEARRDLSLLGDEDWEGATAVIDWLKSYFEDIRDF